MSLNAWFHRCVLPSFILVLALASPALAVELNMRFTPVGGGTVSPPTSPPIQAALGATVAITAAPAGGFRFKGWSLAPAGAGVVADATKLQTSVTPTSGSAPITVTAEFERWDQARYLINLVAATGLDPARHRIYVAGFSTASRLALTVTDAGSKKGGFTAIPNPTVAGQIAALEVGREVTHLELSGANPVDGGRIFVFVADGTAAAPRLAYSVVDGVFGVTQPPSPPKPGSEAYPPFGFVELTWLANQGPFIDVSAVDGLAFPMTISAFDQDGATLLEVGQPTIPGMVSMSQIVAAYGPWMDGLAANGETSATLFKELALTTSATYATTTGTTGTLTMLCNPGTYLDATASATSALHAHFDASLNALFAAPGTLRLAQNGTTFSASATTAAVTGTGLTHQALVFTDEANAARTFTVYNPVGFSVGGYLSGGQYMPIRGTISSRVLTFQSPLPAGTPLSVGMYLQPVFGAGVTTTIQGITLGAGGVITAVTLSAAEDYTTDAAIRRFSKAPLDYFASPGLMVFGCMGLMGTDKMGVPASPSAVDKDTVKGLQNQIVSALHRGVSHLRAAVGQTTTSVWNEQTSWYPQGQPQNLFSYFLHTGKAAGRAIFTFVGGSQPSQRGETMGMAYGFAYDEGELVPSEIKDSMLVGVQSMAITLGPWSSPGGATTGALTMARSAGGSIAPDVGVWQRPLSTAIPVTATAASGYTFVGWQVAGSLTVADFRDPVTSAYLQGDGTLTAVFTATATPVNPYSYFYQSTTATATGLSTSSSSGSHCGLGSGLGLMVLALALAMTLVYRRNRS
ncbi:MAG: hypothetical protein L6R48_12710 [Planctomycetes bacterium]|nr:hypothetical protein [Planctomycetota bacterium]